MFFDKVYDVLADILEAPATVRNLGLFRNRGAVAVGFICDSKYYWTFLQLHAAHGAVVAYGGALEAAELGEGRLGARAVLLGAPAHRRRR